MTPSPRHVPFECRYRPDYEVVEERRGKVHCYPHTDQLPVLWRALDLEFRTALPGYIARVDKRGDGFHKNLLKHAGLMFCSIMNAARPDQVRLFSLPDRDLVTRIAIVQQITEETKQGPLHRFKFYAGPDFYEEIRLSGRRLVFRDHVLQRFSARVPNAVGEDLSSLLLAVFGSPYIALKVGPAYAFVVPYMQSLLAFPFTMDETEFLLTSCLTINEINSLEPHMPPPVFNPNYGETFAVPRTRHWQPTRWMLDLIKKWECKVPLPPAREGLPKMANWHWVANWIKDNELKKGFGPGTRLLFWDHLPGPCTFEISPSQTEPLIDERKIYQDINPGPDWEKIFAELEATTLKPIQKPASAPA